MSDIEAGGSDLRELLRHMSPELMPGEFVFMEQEGLTLIVPRALADGHQHNYSSVFSCITLQVQSSLEAVGLTAAFAIQLTRYGVSANVVICQVLSYCGKEGRA